MSLCSTGKPTNPSRAFVYSLLGDGEPHITGVGSPLTFEKDQTSGLAQEVIRESRSILEDQDHSSLESGPIDCMDETDSAVPLACTLIFDCDPLDMVKEDCTSLLNDNVKFGSEDSIQLSEVKSLAGSRESICSSKHNPENNADSKDGLQPVAEINSQNCDSAETSESILVPNNISSELKLKEVADDPETHETLQTITTSQIPPGDELGDGQDTILNSIPQCKNKDVQQHASLQVIDIQIPQDNLDLVPPDPLERSPTKHDTSSDSSELFVTAANSETHSSRAASTAEELTGDFEDQRGWSTDQESIPDMQPDSLEVPSLGRDFAADRSLPAFVLEEGGPPSLSARTPKKLFREEDDEKEIDPPDVNLKNLEDRKLREMERERRRIIGNQAVRRKKIDYWAFVSEDKLAEHQQITSPATADDTSPSLSHKEQSLSPTVIDGMMSPPPSPKDTSLSSTDQLDDVGPSSLNPDDVSSVQDSAGSIECTKADLKPTPSEGEFDIPCEVESDKHIDGRTIVETFSLEATESGISPPASPKPSTILGFISPSASPKGWSASPSVLRSVSPPVMGKISPRMTSPSPLSFERVTSPACSSLTPATTYPPSPPESPRSCAPTSRLVTPPASPVSVEYGSLEPEENVLNNQVDDVVLKELGDQLAEFKHREVVARSPSLPEPGTVDCASILENKERLRLFWDRRIMAEQENAITASAANGQVTGGASEPVEVTPPDSLNEESLVDLNEPDVQPSPSTEESALDCEVRQTLERELELKQEQADRQQETVSEELITMSVEDVNPQVVEDLINIGEDLTVKNEATLLEDVDIKDEIVEKKTSVEDVQLESSVDTETPEELVSFTSIDGTVTVEAVDTETAEGDQVVNKPQIVGETYHLSNGSPPPSTTPQSPIPAALPTPKSDRPPFNPSADSKIAQEIQEMQEREDELRRMREALQNGAKSPGTSSLPSEGGSVHSDEGHGPVNGRVPSPFLEEKPNNYINGLDSVPQGQTLYNVGYAFGHRRKDGVKVKPLADQMEDESQGLPAFQALKESPIEREIRMVKEREEELKKDKEILLTNGLNGDARRPSTLLLNGRSRPPSSTTTPVAPVSDTQRFMATNRIQLEIVEQTEREMALRASGKIQTISQERTDAKVTRLRDVTSPADKKALLLTSSPPASPVLSSSASDSDKYSPGLINGTNGISNGTNGINDIINGINGSVTNGHNGHHQNGSTKTPSPSNSTISGGQIKTGPVAAGRRFSNPPPGRGVSMQRFIASKGKELSFSTFNAKSKEKSNSVVSLHSYNGSSEFLKGSPKMAAVAASAAGTKRCVPAETKIQEELKEMQAREDELKAQRARLLGLSQPNLSTLECDDDLQVTNGHHNQRHHHQGSNGTNGMDRASSNPNLLDEDQYDENNEKISVGGPRRRSMLIDQWEKRIQKLEVIKA